MTAFTESQMAAFAWVYAITLVEPGQFATYQPATPSSRDLWALQHQAQIVVTNNYVCDGETGV